MLPFFSSQWKKYKPLYICFLTHLPRTGVDYSQYYLYFMSGSLLESSILFVSFSVSHSHSRLQCQPPILFWKTWISLLIFYQESSNSLSHAAFLWSGLRGSQISCKLSFEVKNKSNISAHWSFTMWTHPCKQHLNPEMKYYNPQLLFIPHPNPYDSHLRVST